MFYRISFWLCFIVASLACALLMMMNGYGESFIQLILLSFALGFGLAVLLTTAVRGVIHSVFWLANINDYRNKRHERRRLF